MIYPLSPTVILPTLPSLYTHNAARLKDSLRVLREVYFPHQARPTSLTNTVPVLKQSLSDAVPVHRLKRTARLLHHDGVPDSGYASAEEDDFNDDQAYNGDSTENEDKSVIDSETDALDLLRSDEFERGYAIKWLTGLVKRGDGWVSSADFSLEEESERTIVIDDASRLLALFAGDDKPEEAVTRTFSFPFRLSAGSDDETCPITIEMNDAPVDGSDHTAVGLQSWGSAIILAKHMCANPERYLGLTTPRNAHTLRILELGAGTGMLSIVASKLLTRLHVEGSILATDYHPDVLSNLAHNVHVNLPAPHAVMVERLDWSEPPERGASALYDVVLAADVIYDRRHASWIRACVARTMRRDGVFWMIMPLRAVGRHEGLGKTVVEAFPDTSVRAVSSGDGSASEDGNGAKEGRLGVVYREEVDKLDGVGRADEGGYTLLEIRWV